MTPTELARRVVSSLPLTPCSRVLEPGFGDGAFLIALIEAFAKIHSDRDDPVGHALQANIFGVEIDEALYSSALDTIERTFGYQGETNLMVGDFFSTPYPLWHFDIVVGNPPYGGTFNPAIEDALDRQYGSWNGHKVKKETYSFFIARSLELLKPDGSLRFVSSDTFLTITTMGGLRRRLMDECICRVERLQHFSDETAQPVLVLDAVKSGPSDSVVVDGVEVKQASMLATSNFSWQISPDLDHYFSGVTIGDFMLATGGLVTGNNAMFVRSIFDQKIEEPYNFVYFDDPITVSKERGKARLNRLPPKRELEIGELERSGATRRSVRTEPKESVETIALPHPDYRFYNKSDGSIVFAPPKYAIFWKDDGDAVLTFKKAGNWYLHGVGGRKFYGRQGMTWQLVASRINMRFLPEAYIIDSGAPSAFLRDGVHEDEFWFIFAWSLSNLATQLMKTVINHTRNIQGKDLERLPYPIWVSLQDKQNAIDLMKRMVQEGMSGRVFSRQDPEFGLINGIFERSRQD